MNLKAWMYINDWKQIRVASRAGINPAVFNRFLNGHNGLHPDYVEKLSKILGISSREIELREVDDAMTHLKEPKEEPRDEEFRGGKC